MLQHASMQCVNNILKYTTQTWVTYHNYNLYNVTRILNIGCAFHIHLLLTRRNRNVTHHTVLQQHSLLHSTVIPCPMPRLGRVHHVVLGRTTLQIFLMGKTELHKCRCFQIPLHLKYANLWTLNTSTVFG